MLAFSVAETGLRYAGVSEQNISYLEAAASVAMFLILRRRACFVAGTPVLVPNDAGSGTPPVDPRSAAVARTTDRGVFFAGAALLVGLEHLRNRRRAKSCKRARGITGSPCREVNAAGREGRPFHESPKQCTRDDRISDICLARNTLCCGGEPRAANGGSPRIASSPSDGFAPRALPSPKSGHRRVALAAPGTGAETLAGGVAARCRRLLH